MQLCHWQNVARHFRFKGLQHMPLPEQYVLFSIISVFTNLPMLWVLSPAKVMFALCPSNNLDDPSQRTCAVVSSSCPVVTMAQLALGFTPMLLSVETN